MEETSRGEIRFGIEHNHQQQQKRTQQRASLGKGGHEKAVEEDEEAKYLVRAPCRATYIRGTLRGRRLTKSVVTLYH